MSQSFILADEAATHSFAAQLAEAVLSMWPLLNQQKSFNIYLSGELGAGKTSFVRGFLRAMGYEGKVKSPSYGLIEPYVFSEYSVFHFDFYRIQSIQELASLGLEDYFSQKAICLIEWPEQAFQLLPPADIFLRISIQGTQRRIELDKSFGKKGLL